jgi:hypothetical protein
MFSQTAWAIGYTLVFQLHLLAWVPDHSYLPPLPPPKEHFCRGLVGTRSWPLAFSGVGAAGVAHVLP